MKVSKFLSLAIVSALVAAPAAAQFTALVAPPKPKVEAAAVAALPAGAQKDSLVKVTMTNMKDWVDSAAASLGVAVTPAVADTAARQGTPPFAVPARPAAAPVPPPPAHATTEFREGARAPNTATPLPLVALLGALIFGSGLWLLRPRRASQRS